MRVFRVKAALAALAASPAALFASSSPAMADEVKIRGMLARPPFLAYTSAKSQAALEECLGVELSAVGIPSVLHGEGKTLLSSWQALGGTNSITFLIVVTPAMSGNNVVIRTGAAGFMAKWVERKAREIASTCN